MLKRIIAKKVFTAFLYPASLLYIVGSWFFYHLAKNSLTKRVRYVFFSVFAFTLIISSQPFSSILIHSLEKKYPCLIDSNEIKSASYIIVLGGGFNFGKNMPATTQLGNSSLLRLIEGMRLKLINPRAKLIFSGGKPYTEDYSEAKIYEKSYQILSNDTTKQILSILPHNTKSEAVEAYRIVGKQKLILVTSASHMQRAMYLFKKEGCNVVAAPCDFNVKELKYYPGLPNGSSIKTVELALHEYVGILGYKLFD